MTENVHDVLKIVAGSAKDVKFKYWVHSWVTICNIKPFEYVYKHGTYMLIVIQITCGKTKYTYNLINKNVTVIMSTICHLKMHLHFDQKP